jgi:hypothetical protein
LRTHPVAATAVAIIVGVLLAPLRWIRGDALASPTRSHRGSSRMGSFVQ